MGVMGRCPHTFVAVIAEAIQMFLGVLCFSQHRFALAIYCISDVLDK